jgi:hypothetical protein
MFVEIQMVDSFVLFQGHSDRSTYLWGDRNFNSRTDEVKSQGVAERLHGSLKAVVLPS